MSTSWLVLLGVVALALYAAMSIRNRYYAAMNVLMARYTFDRLNRPEQEAIKEEARSIVAARGLKISGYVHDIERFGWYALAMNALKVKSKLPENPAWYAVHNPTKALKKDDRFLRIAKLMVKQNYGVEIDVT